MDIKIICDRDHRRLRQCFGCLHRRYIRANHLKKDGKRESCYGLKNCCDSSDSNRDGRGLMMSLYSENVKG